MDVLMQSVLTALALGALYGALGIGFVIVHRLTGMVNFAMGDIAVAGAFGAVVASSVLPPLAAIGVGALTGAVVSVLMYHLAIHPLRHQSLMVQTIVTLGVGIAIRSAIQLIFGTGPRQFEPITSGSSLTILGGSIPLQSLWLVGLTVVGYLGLAFFFDRTLSGKALSAFSVNAYAAGVVGISLTVMATIAFALSGAIAGGVLAAQVPTSFITAGAGLALGLKGFIAAILGGFEKLGLTLVGGFIVALVEVLVARNVSAAQASTIVFLLLIVLLVVRPQGLTRKVAADRV
ncbi:branched-chain amino acid ABC transporter permease [Occultella gossypii]|uniref:Branched-chain amino acid ABC transporter permease n=1 Tax=Occultella gossypii TaxID=2800820 RepID=A0ABS7S5T7_9MICO|nr:branched-chain amino acid ABC transporter permease [Occultella gossypii]MBZ2195447.1 branched-chain amino acid ABC transporter permease [Occultella gossypii]